MERLQPRPPVPGGVRRGPWDNRDDIGALAMAVSIRLHRAGSNKQPFFRLVAADSRRATSGKILEVLGWYDPKKKVRPAFSINLERVEHWEKTGAHLSETARSLVRRARGASIGQTA